MKKLNKVKLVALILAAVQLVAMVVFYVRLYKFDMLPAKYFILAVVISLVMVVVTVLIIRFKVGTVISIILSVLLSVVYIYGCTLVDKTEDTIDNIVGITAQENTVGAFVLYETDISSGTEFFKTAKIGTNKSYDLKNTLNLLDKVSQEIDYSLSAHEYNTPVEMFDALYAKEVDVVVVNEAYLTILKDIDKYVNIETEVKILYEYNIVEEVEEEEPENVEPPENIVIEPFIMYISGSDTRSQLLVTSRSDVNIIAVVNPNTRKILLVNTPRDYYVPLPNSNGVPDKLTHAGIYGIKCSMGTLEMLYDINIDYYGQLNFTGFKQLVDAVGGITIKSDYEFNTWYGRVVKGYNDFNGKAALAFARWRYDLPGGDRQRGKHQMLVIEALIDKLTSRALLLNYTDIMDSMQGTFATNVTKEQIALAVKKQLNEGKAWSVEMCSVTGSDAEEVSFSMPTVPNYVMVPDMKTVDAAKEKINAVLNGQ